MRIAVLTFDRFNELDSFVAAALLNRLAPLGWCGSSSRCRRWRASRSGSSIGRGGYQHGKAGLDTRRQAAGN